MRYVTNLISLVHPLTYCLESNAGCDDDMGFSMSLSVVRTNIDCKFLHRVIVLLYL